MPNLKLKFDQGLNTASDRADLLDGELVQATGVRYKPGDKRAWKIRGNVEFGDTGSGKRIDGVALLRHDDSGGDRLVALSDKVLYGADITSTGATGTFSTLKSGLGTLATSLSAAQSNDKHYLALGSENLVVKSDGTTYSMGMKAPSGKLTGVGGTGSIEIQADASSGVFDNASNAIDTGTDRLSTYASKTLSSIGSSKEVYSWTTADAATGRVIEVRWALSGLPIMPEGPASDGDFDDVGSGFDSGFLVNIKFEISEDNGATYTEVLNQKRVSATSQNISQFDITDSLEISGNLLFRVTFTYNTGNLDASLYIYDVNVNDGGSGTNITTTAGGFYYAVSEYDENEGVEGPAIVSEQRVSLTTQNSVTLTLPTSTNSRATHWRIYRTTDGGSVPQDLGLISSDRPIASTTFIDTLTLDKDTQAYPFYPLLRVLTQQDASAVAPLYFPQNSPPRRFNRLRVYQGSLVGLTDESPRALFYSMAGRPESWPEINVVESFPFEEHDVLVDCVSLGQSLIIAAEGMMLRMVGLPRVVSSVQDRSQVEPIKGAPGCVGKYALTSFSVSGQPRAAWISNYGLYITDGDSVLRVSEDISWDDFDGLNKSGWVLQWDHKLLCLIMSRGDGFYYYIHMSPDHRKPNGQPKWTGPHYGNFTCMTSGQLADGTHRLYAGHASDGSVYTLDVGGVDASQAYSGTQLPMVMKTGQMYSDDKDWAALDAHLYHTDFGSQATCTLDWEVDVDSETGSGFVKSQSVSLGGHKGTQIDISKRCQWAQATITHTGGSQGAIRHMDIKAQGRGKIGSKRVA